MRNQSNLSQEEKIIYVQKILNGEESIQRLAKTLKWSSFTITLWLNKYQMDGTSGLACRFIHYKRNVISVYCFNIGMLYNDINKILNHKTLKNKVLNYKIRNKSVF